MSSLDLSSVNAKLAWAWSHFQIVNADIEAWQNKSPHAVLHQHNESHTQHYLSASLPGDRPDFRRWSLVLGDCLTNLRDALDHLVYAIAQRNDMADPAKRERASFLIYTDPTEYKKAIRSKLACLPIAVQEVITSVQPFNRSTHSGMKPWLEILADLANGNKHRMLNLAFTSPSIASLRFASKNKDSSPSAVTVINPHDIEDGTLFLIFEVTEPDPTLVLENGIIRFEVVIKHKAMPGDKTFNAGRSPCQVLIPSLFEEVRFVLRAISVAVGCDPAAIA